MAWKNPWYDPSKAHHTAGGFRNPEARLRQQGEVRRWRKERKARRLPLPPEGGYDAFISQWWQSADLSGHQDALWWLGHACMMLRIRQRYTLIDPALSQRASPLQFYGPSRKTPVPLTIDRLPALDNLLITHNHYDHLDRQTVKEILQRFPEVNIVVPLGLKAWFKQLGARHVSELDWWDDLSLTEMTIYGVPARHWSMRSLNNRNRSLWCGWVIQAGKLNFWFTGDTGYSANLMEIPHRLGPFNLAALPIGAYAPRWFMQEQHMDPQQAVLLHQQLGCPLSVPIHWGVFELGDESLDSPPVELVQSVQESGLQPGKFSAWKIGARVFIENICHRAT